MINNNFSELLNKFQLTTDQLVKHFQDLSPTQLNWKPNSDEWSIGQCVDHLIMTNKHYLTVLEKVLRNEKKTFWEQLPILPNFFGNLLIKFLKKDNGKFKAPKSIEPTNSQIDKDIIKKFNSFQNQLAALMQKTSFLELDKIIITSPVNPVITYSLLHTYNIITTHDQRHFEQALKVFNSPSFPKN